MAERQRWRGTPDFGAARDALGPSQGLQANLCRAVEQLELALEDLLVAVAVAVAEEGDALIDEGQDEPAVGETCAPALRRRPRVSEETLRARRELDPGASCPDCGGDLRVVGEDVSELLDMIAAQMKVIQIARLKKPCRRCEKMVQELAPSRSIPGSMAGPNLLAHVPPFGDASIACRLVRTRDEDPVAVDR